MGKKGAVRLGKGHTGVFINIIYKTFTDSPDLSKRHVHLFWYSLDKKTKLSDMEINTHEPKHLPLSCLEMSSESGNVVVEPNQPSASELRRQKRETARLARAQQVSQKVVTRRIVTVYEGDPGTSRDPDPMNTKGWTLVTGNYRRRNNNQ